MGWGDTAAQAIDGIIADRRQRLLDERAAEDQRYTRGRNSRLDSLQEEYQRGRLAVAQAAGERARRAEEALRDRQAYLERMKALSRESAPLESLAKAYPEAKASPFTGEVFRLDEALARRPELAEQPAFPGEQPAPGAEGPHIPTNREVRASNLEQAMSQYGGAAMARTNALAELRRRIAGIGAAGRGASSPKTTALDIQLRAVQAKRKQAEQLAAGLVTNPKSGLLEVLNPEALPEARAQAARLLTEAAAEERALQAAYGATGATAPVGMGPAALQVSLEQRGLPEDEILRQLTSLYDDATLQAAGILAEE